jgi:hypothetical protein
MARAAYVLCVLIPGEVARESGMMSPTEVDGDAQREPAELHSLAMTP